MKAYTCRGLIRMRLLLFGFSCCLKGRRVGSNEFGEGGEDEDERRRGDEPDEAYIGSRS
jgi:hypothetical protein